MGFDVDLESSGQVKAPMHATLWLTRACDMEGALDRICMRQGMFKRTSSHGLVEVYYSYIRYVTKATLNAPPVAEIVTISLCSPHTPPHAIQA